MSEFSFEQLQQMRVANIQSQFVNSEELQKGEQDELEKARHGTYADTAENRRLNRVGQEYGHKAEEKQPSGQRTKKTEEASGAGGKTVADHAADTDSKVLQKVVDDPNAKLELKEAAQAELKKRGEGDESDKSKYQVLEEKFLNGEIDSEYIRTMDTEITDNDPKIGEFMVKRALETLEDHKNSTENDLKKTENFAKKELKTCKPESRPHYLGYIKGIQEVRKMRANGDERFKEREKTPVENKREEKIKKIANNALSLVNGIKNRGEAESSWLTTKSGINALSKVRKSALDFAKKNPDVEFTSEMCEALAELPLNEFIDEYGYFKGLEEYATAVEDYLSTIDEYEMSEEEEAEEEAFDKEMKRRISSAKNEIVSALIADQGQLRDDADKIIKKLKLAAINFVKKNPDLKVKSSMWDEIVSGENPNKYRHYDGFKQLDEAIDEYIG